MRSWPIFTGNGFNQSSPFVGVTLGGGLREPLNWTFRACQRGETFNRFQAKRGSKRRDRPRGSTPVLQGNREDQTVMSLPFVLFACAIGAAWMRQRGVSMGFWVLGLATTLLLFRVHITEALNIQL